MKNIGGRRKAGRRGRAAEIIVVEEWTPPSCDLLPILRLLFVGYVRKSNVGIRSLCLFPHKKGQHRLLDQQASTFGSSASTFPRRNACSTKVQFCASPFSRYPTKPRKGLRALSRYRSASLLRGKYQLLTTGMSFNKRNV
jgi:hypothetical protein